MRGDINGEAINAELINGGPTRHAVIAVGVAAVVGAVLATRRRGAMAAGVTTSSGEAVATRRRSVRGAGLTLVPGAVVATRRRSVRLVGVTGSVGAVQVKWRQFGFAHPSRRVLLGTDVRTFRVAAERRVFVVPPDPADRVPAERRRF